jgi:hypothetical protein
MENEDKPIKRENMGEERPVEQTDHGFSTQSSSTLDQEQEDELSSTPEKNDTNVKADLPPKINSTKREG